MGVWVDVKRNSGVQDGVASAAGAMPQGLGQVRLAGARGAA